MPTNTAGALEVVVYQIPVKLSRFPVPRENNVRGAAFRFGGHAPKYLCQIPTPQPAPWCF